MTRRLMEGSEAIAEAGIAAGCRFFAVTDSLTLRFIDNDCCDIR